MQVAYVQDMSGSRGPYICPNCNRSFEQFEEFNAHTKENCSMDSEKKPFCIIFRATSESANQKKLNLTVDDYFYGYANGSSKYKKRTYNKKFSCYSCGKHLRNNLRFMSHVRHKIENEWKENDNVNDFNICSHCYRHYASPFHLQCHIETVHATVPASTTCRICELNFANEELFLSHMKDRHRYNEMPYICKLCNYRSSFYLDLTQHFKIAHENCNTLLCLFCLAIFQTANSYLAHVIQHMNKSVRCTRCRLQYFTVKDKTAHLEADHQSVICATGKRKLPKNLQEHMIYVKVSHNASSPTKQQQQQPSVSTPPVGPSRIPKLGAGWLMTNFDEKIPEDCQAYVRDTSVYIVLPPDKLGNKPMICVECREDLGNFASEYTKHFKREVRCQKCPFFTHCQKAALLHILREHVNNSSQNADSSQNSMVSPTNAGGVTLRNSKTLPPRSIVFHKPAADSSNNENRSTRKGSPRAAIPATSTVLKRDSTSQQNTAKISAKDRVVSSSAIGEKSQILSGSFSSTKSVSTSHKTRLGKRKMTDIDALLETATKKADNEAQRSIALKSTKQRRKQLKPQKVLADDEFENNSPSKQSASTDVYKKTEKSPAKKYYLNTRSANIERSSAMPPPSPLLKPLKQVASEEMRKRALKSMSPPALESLDGPEYDVNCADVTPSVSSRKRSPEAASLNEENEPTSSNKLAANFVSQLGLGKCKEIPSTSSNHPETSNEPLSKTSSQLSTFPSYKPNLYKTPLSGLKWIQYNPAPTNTARKSASSSLKTPPKQSQTTPQPRPSNLAFAPSRDGSIILQKSVSQLERPKPPSCIRFLEVTKSSFLVSWDPPTNCNVTEYQLIFQGSGLPTTQRLPPTQTTVRLVGLRSNTFYVVRICSFLKSMQSCYVEAIQRTLGLRENKKTDRPKVDQVIVLDDDDDDDDDDVILSSKTTAVSQSKTVSSTEQSFAKSKNNSDKSIVTTKSVATPLPKQSVDRSVDCSNNITTSTHSVAASLPQQPVSRSDNCSDKVTVTAQSKVTSIAKHSVDGETGCSSETTSITQSNVTHSPDQPFVNQKPAVLSIDETHEPCSTITTDASKTTSVTASNNTAVHVNGASIPVISNAQSSKNKPIARIGKAKIIVVKIKKPISKFHSLSKSSSIELKNTRRLKSIKISKNETPKKHEENSSKSCNVSSAATSGAKKENNSACNEIGEDNELSEGESFTGANSCDISVTKEKTADQNDVVGVAGDVAMTTSNADTTKKLDLKSEISSDQHLDAGTTMQDAADVSVREDEITDHESSDGSTNARNEQTKEIPLINNNNDINKQPTDKNSTDSTNSDSIFSNSFSDERLKAIESKTSYQKEVTSDATGDVVQRTPVVVPEPPIENAPEPAGIAGCDDSSTNYTSETVLSGRDKKECGINCQLSQSSIKQVSSCADQQNNEINSSALLKKKETASEPDADKSLTISQTSISSGLVNGNSPDCNVDASSLPISTNNDDAKPVETTSSVATKEVVNFEFEEELIANTSSPPTNPSDKITSPQKDVTNHSDTDHFTLEDLDNMLCFLEE